MHRNHARSSGRELRLPGVRERFLEKPPNVITSGNGCAVFCQVKSQEKDVFCRENNINKHIEMNRLSGLGNQVRLEACLAGRGRLNKIDFF